ncbi:MAG: hypothetical protein QME70_08185 [Bacillota bacterium]|nr:hypothetical protein [Bacillota bacterium]
MRTMTGDILMLSDWLSRAGCTHVAMESTGVYCSAENRDHPLLGGSLQVLQFDLIAERFEPFHQTAGDSIAVCVLSRIDLA